VAVLFSSACANKNMALFWVVVPYVLVEVYQCFEVFAVSIIKAKRQQAPLKQWQTETTWHYNPEDSHLHASCHENPKSCLCSDNIPHSHYYKNEWPYDCCLRNFSLDPDAWCIYLFLSLCVGSSHSKEIVVCLLICLLSLKIASSVQIT
jgi:hypothetical protein